MALSDDRQILSGPTQLVLVVLVLSPLWYIVFEKMNAHTDPTKPSSYCMACPGCNLEYFCGPGGASGMKCPRCPPPPPALVFRTLEDTSLWTPLARMFVGIVSFLAVAVLVFGTQKPKRVLVDQPEDTEKAVQERAAAAEETKTWAVELVREHRRRAK